MSDRTLNQKYLVAKNTLSNLNLNWQFSEL
jgi:hypothetical protein